MSVEHILYIVLSLITIGIILFAAHYIKSQKWKNIFLLFWALACFFMHNIWIYATFIQNNGSYGTVADNQIFPIYFCNFMMFILLFVSIWPNKHSTFFKWVSTFVAYGGTFGALITVFATAPGLNNLATAQSAFSHSFMLIGCLWLFVGGYVKINVYNLIPYTAGLLMCGVVGGLIELFFFAFKMPSPNAMYLVHGPVELPEFKWWMFAICMLVIIFAFTALWELFTRKKENRWYKNCNDVLIYLPCLQTRIRNKNN